MNSCQRLVIFESGVIAGILDAWCVFGLGMGVMVLLLEAEKVHISML